MKRVITILISFFIWQTAYGVDFVGLQEKLVNKKISKRYVAYQLYRNKLYFSSLSYLKEFYQKSSKPDKEMDKLLEVLLVKAGTESLGDLSDDVLSRIDTPTVALIKARRDYYNKRYSRALNNLSKIPQTHRLAPDRYILEGMIAYQKQKYYQALEAYAQCSVVAMNLKEETKSKPLKRYYDVLSEGCIIDQARIYFKQKKYKRSLEYYRLIPKRSYHWPYILLEQAWNYYYLHDYNRVLGLLVTYKAPLLQSYFFPEAEMLKALAYYRLCLWDDALKVIERYYRVYKPRSDQLRLMLNKHKESFTFFFDLLNTPITKNEKKNIFIRKLIVMVKKKVKYNLDKYSYNNAKQEFYSLKKMPKGKLRTELLSKVREEALYRKAKINHFTKVLFFDFLNEIYRFSNRLFNLKLEILASQRQMLYKQEKFSKRERGSLSEVQRSSVEYIFGFDGEFWADELGDYSFGLKSRCEKEQNIKEANRKEDK